jgi:hypothetical protein
VWRGKMSRVRNANGEELALLDDLNERLKPYGFTVIYYNKGGLKNSRRPWRFGRKNENMRYFDSPEQLAKYVEGILNKFIEIEKMNVTFRLYGMPLSARLSWRDNTPVFAFIDPNGRMVPRRYPEKGFAKAKYGILRLGDTRYTSWEAFRAAFSAKIADRQRYLTEKNNAAVPVV